jgi:hypothetical protein
VEKSVDPAVLPLSSSIRPLELMWLTNRPPEPSSVYTRRDTFFVFSSSSFITEFLNFATKINVRWRVVQFAFLFLVGLKFAINLERHDTRERT